MPAPSHTPVMLRECLEYLGVRPGGIFLDATCGLAGHTAAIAKELAQGAARRAPGSNGFVLACDRDAESLALAKENTLELADWIRFRKASFSQLGEVVAAESISGVDGLLADLGVSKYQLTSSERGFSLMMDGPLDMRQDRGQERSASDIVNYESEKGLADLIYQLGEERRSRRIARAIVRARPIHTTGQLAKLIEQAVPRTGKIHPATQTFMALRIAVNEENEELEALLEAIPRLVKPGGRVVVLTFMSLEDRRVKQSFQAMARDGRANILTRHVVRPSEEEIRDNSPSRSAKLRALEMV
jgi:16S rRNA (cytosine1402-N4)-methyltransferase